MKNLVGGSKQGGRTGVVNFTGGWGFVVVYAYAKSYVH